MKVSLIIKDSVIDFKIDQCVFLVAKRTYLSLLLFFVLALVSHKGLSQDITAEKGSFGVDKGHNIIVWHANKIDSLFTKKDEATRLNFDKQYTILEPQKRLSPNTPYRISDGEQNYSLYLTKLPIVHIGIDTLHINGRKKILGTFTYFNEGGYIQNIMGVRHRGNLSLTFPKKSYDIEFWSDSTGRENKDLQFNGLRKDDDWILDGLYNEPLRLRSYVAVQIWQAIHQPYYLDREPEAKSGFDFRFVEVFKNEEYIGLYALSESIDRKQLGLRKNDNDNILGELFKAESYKDATYFKEAPEYNNLFPHWSGFRMEYPLLDYRAHWNDLAKLVNLVATAPKKDFVENIEGQIKINNVMDYYLFVNLLRATDNLGKNYYLGRYDEHEPYFIIPWDLDGVLGTILDGKRISTTNDLLSNNLFDRLLSVDPNGFKTNMKQRWLALRKEALSDTNINERITKRYDLFVTSKIYEREGLVWPRDFAVENHYEYLKTWLDNRLKFLDNHFKNL